jgi:hypothetical protein
MMAKVAVAIVILMAVSTMTLAARADAQTREITGQLGVLGEWELTATVTKQTGGGGQLWVGPLSLKHIGFCSVDGPEEKAGELRLGIPDLISNAPGEIAATLLIDGTICTFKGHRANAYNGVMVCPDRANLPMMLMLQ